MASRHCAACAASLRLADSPALRRAGGAGGATIPIQYKW